MNKAFIIAREDVAKICGNNPRVMQQFEEMQRAVAENSDTTGANVDATTALGNATFITLSPNAELDNEYVLQVGEGLRLEASGGIVRLFLEAAIITSGHAVRFIAAGDSTVALPIAGVLATRDNVETLTNKTLDAPKLSGLGNYANDAAAAAGGVPVEGVYRNGSIVMVRVT